MLNIILETNRLMLRNFCLDDVQLIYQLNSDPEVTRFTGDLIKDINHAKEVLEKSILPQYALYKHGRWAVIVKSMTNTGTNGFIGWCGLKMLPERNEIDLGYRFMKDAWGNGYASEAAFACLQYGFKELGIKRIVGRAMAGNLASIRVLEKCGMVYIGEDEVDGHLERAYEMINPFIH